MFEPSAAWTQEERLKAIDMIATILLNNQAMPTSEQMFRMRTISLLTNYPAAFLEQNRAQVLEAMQWSK